MKNTDRPNPFSKLDRFKPKESDDSATISSDIEAIASASKWPSREAPLEKATHARRPFGTSTEPPKVQFNIRVDEEDKERFYRIAEEKGIQKLGVLFKQCLDALEQVDSLKQEKS
jgi:hypothetical protein